MRQAFHPSGAASMVPGLRTHTGNTAGTMRIWTLFLAVALALLLGDAASAQQQSPKFVASYRDWHLWQYEGSGGTVCFIHSEPTREEGNYTRRGQAAVMVTRLPGELASEQVSVQPGYTYKSGSNVQLSIDNRSYSLFTRGEHAWANTPEDDKALIEAMKRGSDLKVRGTSTRDTFSLDTYSLLGFTAAYQAMLDACRQ
ncbi:MAG TPA: invasion associated locus B family protein [Geminicoccaceae bacterium]|nr:invasion associated locus B family protein [Geminicoccaceae bacterium]